MNTTQIEQNVNGLIKQFNNDECADDDFIYELLLAYGHNKTGIKRLRSGERNIAKDPSEVIFKRHLYFKKIDGDDLLTEIDRMRNERLVSANRIRFVVVTNYKKIVAVDTKTADTLGVDLLELPKKFDFFLPWANIEKAVYQGEDPADIKAAEKMAKLFDLIKADNESHEDSDKAHHHLNVFLSRILFCFFAEDTEIFGANQFSESIESHTNTDGSDVAEYLNRLFKILNTETTSKARENLPDYLAAFRYVNGGLFTDEVLSPKFSTKSRQLLIECGTELDWSGINPDIFGSMFQAVLRDSDESDNTEHYTSVSNILKVIQPLFLNEFYSELEKIADSGYELTRKINNLKKLQNRLSEIKFFDPACGSGNFLIITYKEIRKFEIELLELQQDLHSQNTGGQNFKAFSLITLDQFYGIELDDFAHEIAGLSLWLAEHQMNQEFEAQFGSSPPSLPLKSGGIIQCGNATRLNWNDVCPGDGEIFILGNPPFRGKKEQTDNQKSDMDFVFNGVSSYKTLDYVSCWFVKAATYINNSNALCGLVSTNSITQGEQVGVLWPIIYSQDVEISFGYTSFMWKNNAKHNAGVAVVIIGLAQSGAKPNKSLFIESRDNSIVKKTSKINPYLSSGSDVIVKKRSSPISLIPKIANGSMANDDGNFFLNKQEYEELDSGLKKFFKKAIGAREFFHAQLRYCLWIDENNFQQAMRYDEIQKIVNRVKIYRLKSNREATNELAKVPHRFGEVRYKLGNAMIIPGLSAESREYIPFGFIDDSSVVTNLAQVVYSAKPWLFSLISSKLNIEWVKVTSGYFKKDIRYSPVLSYNNLPVPIISDQIKQQMHDSALNILAQREIFLDKTIANLYDPNEMPLKLKEAHLENDKLIDNLYKNGGFQTGEERMASVFKLYEKMKREMNE